MRQKYLKFESSYENDALLNLKLIFLQIRIIGSVTSLLVLILYNKRMVSIEEFKEIITFNLIEKDAYLCNDYVMLCIYLCTLLKFFTFQTFC